MKQIMKLIALLSMLLLFGSSFAQQNVTLSGIIKTDNEIPAETKVAIHVVDRDGVWQRETVSVSPVAGTFSITTVDLEPQELSPLRSGSILLPGLQNEYTVTPSDGVNYASARVNMYVDANTNQVFDRVIDAFYIGVPSLEDPIGFFALIYVDRDVTLSGRGTDLSLATGWNVYTVRYPEAAEGSTATPAAIFEIHSTVSDIVMDVFLP